MTVQQGVPPQPVQQAPQQPVATVQAPAQQGVPPQPAQPQATPQQQSPPQAPSAEQPNEKEQEQKDLRDCLEQMTNAFNEFHAQITQLKKQQQDVISHIRSRIDQKKIDEIKNTLSQTS